MPSPAVIRLSLSSAILLAGTMAAMADPPGRVGRLSFMEGTVSFHAAGQEQWSAAVLNYPVTTGAAFWTEPAARAEIQVGAAELRLDQSSELDIVQLDDAKTVLHVGQGVVNIHLHSVPAGGLHIVTPHSEADLLAAGSYRIDAGRPDGEALPEHVQIVVLEGKARIDEPRASLEIRPGESAVIGGDPVSFTLVEAAATPFDDWALTRERRETVSVSARYVAPGVTGYEDLDRNGQWSGSQADAVWYPRSVPAGWAPYRNGHWAFVAPWGWTWIDDAPWGFAPFHYGRWVNDNRGWGWHPGERTAAPVYAPALVAFVGGAGWGVSLAAGNAPAVGWIPLGRAEVFHPYYEASQGYARNVNRGNVSNTVVNQISVTNITNTTVNTYANRAAATVVPSADFARAAPVQRAVLALPAAQLNNAAVTGRIDHVQPTAAARVGFARPATTPPPAVTAAIPATIAKGPVVAPVERAVPAGRAPNAAVPAPAEAAVPVAPGPVHGTQRTPGTRAPAAVVPIAVVPSTGSQPGQPPVSPSSQSHVLWDSVSPEATARPLPHG